VTEGGNPKTVVYCAQYTTVCLIAPHPALLVREKGRPPSPRRDGEKDKRHNQISKPFVWTADPDKIIAAAARVGFNLS